jgi:hypothetical protein
MGQINSTCRAPPRVSILVLVIHPSILDVIEAIFGGSSFFSAALRPRGRGGVLVDVQPGEQVGFFRSSSEGEFSLHNLGRVDRRLHPLQVGLHSLPGVRVVTWTALAVINRTVF